MTLLPSHEVFTPGSFPRHTYVAQRGHAYEVQVKESLSVKGLLTSILGPSKSGKTVLVDKVVGEDAVKISGSDISSTDVLWRKVLAQIGISVGRSESKEEAKTTDIEASGGVKAGVPFVVEGEVKTELHRESMRMASESKQYAPAGMDEAISGLLNRK